MGHEHTIVVSERDHGTQGPPPFVPGLWSECEPFHPRGAPVDLICFVRQDIIDKQHEGRLLSVLYMAESLFLRGSDHVAVEDQAGSRIVEGGIDA